MELPQLPEETRLLREDVISRCRFNHYPCSRVGTSCDLGLYGNPLGPFEFLRVQAKLKTKTADMVQNMCRRMETRCVERFQQLREIHQDGDDPKKEKEDVNDIIPSNTVAQRIYRRLQLYYDLQQYVWSKDERTQRAVIMKWQADGPRRQDHLSEGWTPLVHDMALLRGIRKWGFVNGTCCGQIQICHLENQRMIGRRKSQQLQRELLKLRQLQQKQWRWPMQC